MHEAPNTPLPSGYSPRLYNHDLGPLKDQSWNWYNIFAFWMSDVHSVGGYVFAGSLFALGLSSWQVLFALVVGITMVQQLSNLIAKPSQVAGVPYPVVCRQSFGVFGANIPAIIRGLIAVAWYGIQTYLASAALVLVMLRFFPALTPLTKVSFVGLSLLGWAGFMLMWVLQALVFWNGMETIKKFIDWAGPAVYAVMFLLMGWIVWKAGWNKIDFNLSSKQLHGSAMLWQLVIAIALVVSYFSGPLLNFGDFSRYCRSMKDVKRGNFWGLPINFIAFSLVTVVVTAGTLPVFGHIIEDPIEVVGKIDNTFAVVLGAFTFITATIGINIVANFVSPAFDFSNVNPEKISWRTGGMIAAVGSIFITPWNIFHSPQVIHYTLDVLGAFIGPLFGILLVDFYLVHKQQIDIDSLYNDHPSGRYWYKNGYNPRAIQALIASTVLTVVFIVTPGLNELANFAWFIGLFGGSASYYWLSRRFRPVSLAQSVTRSKA